MKLRLFTETSIKAGLVIGGSLLVATMVVGTERDRNPIHDVRVPSAFSTSRTATVETKQPKDFDLNVAALKRPIVTEIQDNLFSTRVPPSPTAPAAQQAASQSVAEPPPKPVAPALPFKYLGKLVDGGVTIVFVAQSGKNLSVREGDLIDNVYRLEQARDAEIVFTYLPMQEQQVLRIGGRH